MNKKITLVLIALIAIGALATTALYFLFFFENNQYQKVDDSGSTPQGIQQVVQANNQFAFDLYYRFANNSQYAQKNLFFSPYSISTALAMTYEGANGLTAQEMKEVFYFPDNHILRPNIAAIYNDLNQAHNDFALKTGNALWAQYDYTFLENFTSRVKQYYGAKVFNLDFAHEAENARHTINSYVEQQTNNKIKNIIGDVKLIENAKLVLTNAIYFKGTWEWEFDKSKTKEREFHITPNNTITTQMMQMSPEKTNFNYAEFEKFHMLELPYKGDKISMLLLLPKQDAEYDLKTKKQIVLNYTLNDIELSAEKLNEYKTQMKSTGLDFISIPKFELDTDYAMKKTLIDMGMPSAFFDADFSGMDGSHTLSIAEVLHKAYVKVDEQGTEAAAATAVIMKQDMASLQKPKPVFVADHPFIVIIQEKNTGNILFLGKIIDPTK